MLTALSLVAVAAVAVPLQAPVSSAAASPAGSSAQVARAAVKPSVIVSMGDSYISGVGGRWAGNTRQAMSRVDALGATAYFDNATRTAERTPGCLRSRTAEVHIGGPVATLNLACSGARTVSTGSGDSFTPGMDFYNDGKGHKGQALLLREVAARYNVRLVVVSIGGNDLGFSDILVSCVRGYMLSTPENPTTCSTDPQLAQRLSPAAFAAAKKAVTTAVQNVRRALRLAGQADGTYDVIVQTYPSALPPSLRYPEAGTSRFSVGGCPFWDADARWASTTVLPLISRTLRSAAVDSGVKRLHILELGRAFEGRRLCEGSVRLLEEVPLASWRSTGAVDRTEWVVQITTARLGESLHPNYWGQQAMQACLRLAWNGGRVRGGTCTIAGKGLLAGDPRMRLS